MKVDTLIAKETAYALRPNKQHWCKFDYVTLSNSLLCTKLCFLYLTFLKVVLLKL